MKPSDQLRARFEKAKSRRQAVESEISEAYRYTTPSQDPLQTANTVPDRTSIFDTTAEDAVNTLANSIISYLLPQDQIWVSLTASEAFKRSGMPTGQLDLLLEGEQRKFYEALNGSNFYLSASEALKDMLVAGTGCLALEMGEYGLKYTAVPISQLYYLDNGLCHVDTVFRSHCLPARIIAERYKNIPSWISQLNRDRPDEPVDLIESMVPGKGGTFEYGVYSAKDWAPLYEHKVGFQNFIVFRWDRNSGSTWGDSPVRKALPTILVTNRLVMDLLDYGDFASRGAWTSTDESLKDQRLVGGTILYSSEELRPVAFPGNFQVNVNLLKDSREQVRQQLMADVLPPASGSQRMTEQEVMIRHQQFFRRIGTSALRIEEEFLHPTVKNSIKAMQAVGRMGKFALDGNPVCIETRSLVKRVQSMRQVEDIMQLVGVASQLGPAGLTHIDLPKTARFLLETGGFPASLLKPLEQVEQELQAANAAQAAGGMIGALGGQSNQQSTQATGQAMAAMANQEEAA